MLVGAVDAIDCARRLHGKGVSGGNPNIDWRELINFKRTFTEPVPARKEESFADNGIDAFHGPARFRDPRKVEVDGNVLEGRFVLIAVGAVPMPLSIPGEKYLVTSTEFLELGALPQRIVLIGGGFIALEFAHIAARAGAAVTIVEQADRLLKPFDADVVVWLTEKSREIGVEVKTGTRVDAIEMSKSTN